MNTTLKTYRQILVHQAYTAESELVRQRAWRYLGADPIAIVDLAEVTGKVRVEPSQENNKPKKEKQNE